MIRSLGSTMQPVCVRGVADHAIVEVLLGLPLLHPLAALVVDAEKLYTVIVLSIEVIGSIMISLLFQFH